MDIVFADDMKKSMRLALWWLKRELKKNHKVTVDDVREDMDNCGNPAIGIVWEEVKKAADLIEEGYQRKMATDFPMIALWYIYKDTAYMNPGMYILVKILERADEILPLAMKYYSEPKNWYPNRWHDTKEHSDEYKEDGKIADMEGIMADDESIFVPQYQKKRIDDMIKKERSKIKWKRG